MDYFYFRLRLRIAEMEDAQKREAKVAFFFNLILPFVLFLFNLTHVKEKDEVNKLLLLSRGEFEAFYNHAEQEKQALRNEFMDLSNMVIYLIISCPTFLI